MEMERERKKAREKERGMVGTEKGLEGGKKGEMERWR